MRIILKILKRSGLFLATFIILLIVAGAMYRLFTTKPQAPGKLLDINGTQLHIIAEGQKKDAPTLVLESGASGNTEMFHWVAEGLKKNMRIVRYDREGKWFSKASKENITPDFYAKQLHDLLRKNGEKPPYILVGHSMGGPYVRIFRDLYPNEVKGIVFVDASHPQQWDRLEQKQLVTKQQFNLIKTGAVLADMGILGLYYKFFSSEPFDDGLPKESHIRTRALTNYSGQVYKRQLKESEINNKIMLRAQKAKRLDALPVLVFTATEQYNDAQKNKYKKQGIDPKKQVALWFEMQKELKELSSNGQQFIIDANHGTIITKKENADKINKEILVMVDKIKSETQK